MDTATLHNRFIDRNGDGPEPVRFFFAPGRINLIGGHTDYTGGLVLPCAIKLGTLVLALLLACTGAWAGEYDQVQARLASGWNSWNSRSVLSQVLLPEGLAINLGFKQRDWIDERYLREALIGRRGEGAEEIVPDLHALDGRCSSLQIRWQHLAARVETARAGDDLLVLITPLEPPEKPVDLIVQSAMLWNRPGQLSLDNGRLQARLPGREVTVFTTAEHTPDPYIDATSPYLVLRLDGPVGIATGRERTLEEISRVVALQQAALVKEAEAFGELAEAWLAIQSGLAWNTVYEPKHERVVSTVGRLWNEEYGGYCLFGWDNFFLAYGCSLFGRDLALANAVEHLRGITAEGFIPNDNRGNGCKSWDRSQPPVGGLMVRELYRRWPERWFLEAVFEPLLRWNRWWEQRRLNGRLLSYGSHKTANPCGEPYASSDVAARWESGMDDSPMYEGIPFDKERGILKLQDVGLTSLHIADCRALAQMAAILGRTDEERELTKRAERFATELERLWDEETGLYLNRRSDNGRFSRRLSPTLFYPLLAGVPDKERARMMVKRHLLNPAEFWGDHVIPSIARNDPSFQKQRYWKGAIWPPLNFLVYLGLREAGMADVQKQLAEKSLTLFMDEWRRMGYVSENYSSITGRGDDHRLSSDRFHSWGVLMGLMSFVEAGHLPPPEEALER